MNASDVATKLDIAKDTLRAYSLELERAGYRFKRNNRNQRDYSDYDISILNAFLTLSKTHGLTLKDAASKVSSVDFRPSNVIKNNAERESVVSNATSLLTLPTADLEDIFKSMEFMAEHVATLERDNTVLLERLSTLESKQDKTLSVIESDVSDNNKQMNDLISEIKQLNEKMEKLEGERKKKQSLLARIFGK